MSIDPAVLCEKLRAYLPDGDRIEAIVPLTTGFSNETYFVDGTEWILRLPPSAGAMLDGHDVVAQARIYRELGSAAGAPPVPRIIDICEDESVLGVPFFIMERIDGEAIHDTQLQDWFTEANDDFRTGICRGWISAIAGFAKMMPLAILGEPTSPEDDARMWRDFAGAADCAQLVGCFDRLLSMPAPLSGEPAIVHGDPKLSNLMWKDGEISAVLDLEMALNGEPLADLGYMLYFFESAHHRAATPQKETGMFNRDETIALWENVSGRSAEGVFWHEIAQLAKVGAIIAEGTNMYVTGRSDDPKLAYFKQNLDYYLGVIEAMLDAHGF